MSFFAVDLLEELRGQGITLAAVAGKLRYRPASAVTLEQRQALAQHRDELLALLAAEPPADAPQSRDIAQEGPSATGEGECCLPDGALPLWLFDRLRPLSGVRPAPVPADLPPGEVAAALQAAQAERAALVAAAWERWEPKASPVPRGRRAAVASVPRDEAQAARLLAAGERLGWPALALRAGERLAAGQVCWEAFIRRAHPSRLADAERAIGEGDR